MKKFFSTILVFCAALALHAEVTDITSLDNVIYINPITVPAGTQQTLSVNMKNAIVAESFGFDLVLPEGFTVATDGEGFPLATLSTARTNSNITNHFDADFKLDGTLNIQAYSTKENGTISGNDGEVAQIVINIASTVSNGTYPVLIKNIAIADANSVTYTTDQVETSITIDGVSDGRTVLDESSTTIPTATSDEVALRVIRSIKANTWSTLCLPFSMTEAQLKAAFGDDVQLAEFTSYDAEYDTNDNVTAISVTFDDVALSSGLDANWPYLIKVSAPVDEFLLTAKVEPAEDDAIDEYDNGKTGKQRQVWGQFIGTLHAGETIPNKNLFLSDNKFYYSTGITTIKAFRAYLWLADELDDASNANGLSLRIGGETTHVEDLTTTAKNMDVYDLSGRKLQYSKDLEKGVYISNGKKVVVK